MSGVHIRKPTMACSIDFICNEWASVLASSETIPSKTRHLTITDDVNQTRQLRFFIAAIDGLNYAASTFLIIPYQAF